MSRRCAAVFWKRTNNCISMVWVKSSAHTTHLCRAFPFSPPANFTLTLLWWIGKKLRSWLAQQAALLYKISGGRLRFSCRSEAKWMAKTLEATVYFLWVLSIWFLFHWKVQDGAVEWIMWLLEELERDAERLKVKHREKKKDRDTRWCRRVRSLMSKI